MKLKLIFFILAIAGVIYRFYYQFIIPSFNVDEISLCNNIKKFGYVRLLYPLESGQSAPPLFLWFQKFICSLSPFPFWINAKIVSFLISSLGVLYFLKFIKRFNYNIVFIVPFLILLFNPFVINNSLTLKQYGFDLCGIIILLYYFKKPTFFKYAPLFFLFWSFLSNVGMFACATFLLISYIEFSSVHKNYLQKFSKFLSHSKYIILSCFPYVLYFLWFLQQDGADALRNYMTFYWSDSFVPFNKEFPMFWIRQIHNYWCFFYSMTEFIGILIFLFTFILLAIQLYLKKKIFLVKEITCCFVVFGFHVLLSALHLYPLSDRLYLYLIILFLFSFASSLYYIKAKLTDAKFNFLNISFFACITISYSTYFNHSENDIVSLLKFVKSHKNSTMCFTEKTSDNVNSFNNFTNNYFANSIAKLPQSAILDKSTFIVSRVHKKIKPDITADEEPFIKILLNGKKIKIFKKINGYNIYKRI